MSPLPEGPHLDALLDALRVEADGQRALLAGDDAAGSALLREAAAHYRRSWELAGPDSFGRLVGMLKAAVIAGDAGDAARYALDQLGPDTGGSVAAAYARAIASLVVGDGPAAVAASDVMAGASPAFGRAAAAIRAIAEGDGAAYGAAVRAIVADFEGRDEHLTGVAIADTALMLERLAAPRGLACGVTSDLLP